MDGAVRTPASDWTTWAGSVRLIASPNESRIAEVARVEIDRPRVVAVGWYYAGPSVGATIRIWAGIGRHSGFINITSPPSVGNFEWPSRELRVELLLDPGPPVQHSLSVWCAPYAW